MGQFTVAHSKTGWRMGLYIHC